MVTIGTPSVPSATRVLLLGSGELGKELVIELQRLGVEVVAVDRYPNAPAMQVAHRSHVLDLLDEEAPGELIGLEQPPFIVPEIEAIATDVLMEIEKETDCTVIPCARATRLTMDREGIRRVAAEELKLPTSPYVLAESEQELHDALQVTGLPRVVKPVMSSSGKGQSVIKAEEDIASAWACALEGGRAGLPVNAITRYGPAASAVIKPSGDSANLLYGNLDQALAQPGTDLRLFGKPELRGARRMGAALALGNSTEAALGKAKAVAGEIQVDL